MIRPSRTVKSSFKIAPIRRVPPRLHFRLEGSRHDTDVTNHLSRRDAICPRATCRDPRVPVVGLGRGIRVRLRSKPWQGASLQRPEDQTRRPTPGTKHKAIVARRGEMGRGRFRILALDVDGTLLDPDGTLRPRTAEAVARAAEAGIRPVLCTGRRYRRARPVALQLGLNAPIVCNSGAIVKEPGHHGTLWRADLDPPLIADLLELFEAHGQPVRLVHRPDARRGRFRRPRIPHGSGLLRRLRRPEPRARRDSTRRGYGRSRSGRRGRGADVPPLCDRLAERDAGVPAGRARPARRPGQTFVQRSPRYLGTMCEVLRHDASKWSAVLHVAELWGVDPAEICAVGDDVNDVPMIRQRRARRGDGPCPGRGPGRRRPRHRRPRLRRRGHARRRRAARGLKPVRDAVEFHRREGDQPSGRTRSSKPRTGRPGSRSAKGRTTGRWRRTGSSASGRSGSGRGTRGRRMTST